MVMKKAVCLVLSAALAAVSCGCANKDKSQEDASILILETKEETYNTVTAEVGSISDAYVMDGNFDYPYSQLLSFEVDGLVDKVVFDPQSEVKEGDVLIQLRTDEIDKEIETQQLRVDSAKQTLESVKSSGASATEVEFAQISCDIEENKMEQLEAEKAKYSIKAPFDGVVIMSDDIETYKQDPEVHAGQSFGFINDYSRNKLCGTVFGNSLENVYFGTRVEVSQGNTIANGTISDIIYSGSGEYLTCKYVVDLDEGSPEIMDLGGIVIRIRVYEKDNAVLVPTDSIVHVGDRTFVYTLVDGIRVETDVELGIENELSGKTEILSGVNGGDAIVVS